MKKQIDSHCVKNIKTSHVFLSLFAFFAVFYTMNYLVRRVDEKERVFEGWCAVTVYEMNSKHLIIIIFA